MPEITNTKDLLDMRHYWINVQGIGWEIAWWDTDGQRWYRCGSDVPLYHKDGDVLEINGPVDLDDQDEIARLNERLSLVIEAAVRYADPRNHQQVLDMLLFPKP